MKLLDTLAETDSFDASVPESKQRLDELKAGSRWDLPKDLKTQRCA